MNKVKVALVGYGHLGRWHAQKAEALETSELIAIVEPDTSKHDTIREAYQNVEIVADLNSIMNKIDAAIIVTPTSIHHEILEVLIKNNKHVLCEKPVTATYAQSQAIQKLVEGKDLVVQVGHSERFHQAWDLKNTEKNFFEGKSTIKLNRIASFKGRATDVDVVQDLMIHDLDLLMYLFGEEPTAVRSTGYKMRTDKWDHVCSEFSFASGRRAIITVGRNYVEELRELEVVNEHGCLKVDLFRNRILKALSSATEADGFVVETEYPKRDHLFVEQEAFYNSILEKKEPIITLDDGVRAVRYVEKVLESLDNGKEVTL